MCFLQHHSLWENKRTHLSRVVRSAWHRKAPLNLSVFLPYFLPLAPNITRYYMTQDKTRKILKPLQIKGFGTRRDYLTRRHMQFESLLLRQKWTLSPNGDRVLLFLPVHTSKSSINVYQNKIVPQGQKIPCGTIWFMIKFLGDRCLHSIGGQPPAEWRFLSIFQPIFFNELQILLIV